MAHLADQGKLKILVGCLAESPLGIATGVHFALSTPSVIATDLDSDLVMMPDHFFARPYFKNGSRLPIEEPGLGSNEDERAKQKLIKEKKIIFEKVR